MQKEVAKEKHQGLTNRLYAACLRRQAGTSPLIALIFFSTFWIKPKSGTIK